MLPLLLLLACGPGFDGQPGDLDGGSAADGGGASDGGGDGGGGTSPDGGSGDGGGTSPDGGSGDGGSGDGGGTSSDGGGGGDGGGTSSDGGGGGGEADCPAAEALRDSDADASASLQACVDATPEGGALLLAPGRYSLGAQLRLDRAITLGTRDRAGTAACTPDDHHGCAELFLLPAFDDRFGAFVATAAVTVDHLVLHGNRTGRGGTTAWEMCSTLADNSYGFNGTFQASGATLRDSVSMYALCGTGFLVTGSGITGVTVERSTFAYNGRHTTLNMWSDGLTVHDVSDSTFTGNTFLDNTDIDLIFGGCPRCTITGNAVLHTDDPAAGAFAAIMIQKWPTTSGSYEDVDVSGNTVDCGSLRACGSGLYIGSESWYDETPYGTLVDGTTSGLITGNAIQNTMNALYIAARGLAIHGNDFVDAHAVAIPNSCHDDLVSVTPIVVSPTAASCHFNYENIDPVMSVHYSSDSWRGCIPNYPF